MKSSTRLKANSQTAGFTLLELMVIVVMVGILATIAAPSWLGFLNRQRLTTVENGLVQTLKQAQQDAIQRKQTVVVTVKESEAYPTINTGVDINLADGSGIRSGMLALDSFSVTAGTKTEETQIAFNYQGQPIDINSSGDEISQPLPFVISIRSQNFNARKCVVIANLIGSIKTAEGATCDNPGVVPVDPT